MEKQTKHLYIHIPFCKQICTYCDFYRTKEDNEDVKEVYINKIINELKQDNNTYKTIYLGGGTPNFLNDKLLDRFLYEVSLKMDEDCEFTIECNPEFVNINQVLIFKKNKVNRISLGVQCLNETILKLLKRGHKNIDVYNSLKLLNENGIENISVDFIYNLPFLKQKDLNDIFAFIKKYKIKHISFYSLEIKEGSIMNKTNYKIDTDIEEDQLEIIKKEFDKLNYLRYEVSNWAIDAKYKSQHNIAYWKLNDWKGIGVSAYGFENRIYYSNKGNINKWEKINENWTDKDICENIFIMGLRMIDGVDLSNPRNYESYLKLKDKFNFDLVEIKDNKLKAKNIDLLHNILIDLI